MKIEKGKIYELDPNKKYLLIAPNMPKEEVEVLSRFLETPHIKILVGAGEDLLDITLIENIDAVKNVESVDKV